MTAPKRRRTPAKRLVPALLVAALLSGCGSEPGTERSRSAEPQPIVVQWANPDLALRVEGWTVRRCDSKVVALCIDRDGEPAGHLLMEDLPSLGQEATRSADQVQATLAVRTQTIYQALTEDRRAACGGDYEVSTRVPLPVTVAGQRGLRYEATAGRGSEVEERTIGYRVFRGEIETLLEATALDRGACPEPVEPMFAVPNLAQFEDLLDRIVAGSILPEPATFPAGPAVPGGSRDPRLDREPTYGIGISYELNDPAPARQSPAVQ